MNRFSLPSPRRRAQTTPYTRFKFPKTSDARLLPVRALQRDDLRTALFKRRSGERFLSLDDSALECLFAHALSPLAIAADAERERRPVPSAGALHPLYVTISRGRRWQVYLPRPHVLREVAVRAEIAEAIWAEVRTVRDPEEAHLLLILGEVGVMAAHYHNPETLLLREAGCLLGYLGLISEAMDLSFRILGPTGEPWASRLVMSADEVFVGVGTALVGGRVGAGGGA